MQKLLVPILFLTVVLLVVPVLGAAVMVAMVSGAAATCVSQVPPKTAGTGRVVVVQANIKVSLPAAAFRQDLDRTLAAGPDLVSLNEVSRRGDDDLSRPGYGLWRAPAKVRGDDGTAVLWRIDRWSLVDQGRVIIVATGPQEWDHDRAATWVTLSGVGDNAGAGTVSMVSVHHMINPAKYGPNVPLRQQIYRTAMEKLQGLVTGLAASGPVFVAGDFNSQWADDDPWGPRRMLGATPGSPLTSTMDTLGKETTHDGGGTIDYLFYPAVGGVTPLRQWTHNLNSDHHLLGAEFTLGDPTSYPDPTTGAANTPISVGATADEDQRPPLSAVQWKRSAQVIEAGRAIGIPEQGIVIALAVASQESAFQVYANDGRGGDLAADQLDIAKSLQLPHDAVGTDHGSLGVFQQQWPWWGSMAELMDPVVAATKFYEALLQVPGWQTLPVTVAAQTVQRSAHPGAYADDEALARRVYATVTGTPASELYQTSSELAQCAIDMVVAGGGTVVMPIPADLADTDRRNWGGVGASWDSWHTGTDFSVPCGTPVLAAHGGTVEIDTSQAWSGRWLVKVTTGPDQLTTWYAHMQKVLVVDGATVTPGEQIGEVGAEGNVSGPTGCHLHFEVHERGGPIYGPDNVDPSSWLAEHVGRSTPGVRT